MGSPESRSSQELYVYFGHHKCASTYLGDIFRTICWDLRLEPLSVGVPASFGGDLAAHLRSHRADFLLCLAAESDFVGKLPPFRGVHVIRDPRDILVSSYFSHLLSHPLSGWPALAEHRAELSRLSQADGLYRELDCRESQFAAMLAWDYSQPNILELRFEQLVADPYETLLEILRFFQLVDEGEDRYARAIWLFALRTRQAMEGRIRRRLPLPWAPRRIPVERLFRIVYENSFARKTGGRRRGVEDPSSHYRRGTAGHWQEYFDERIKAGFKERYQPLLDKLGYASDFNW